MLSLHPRGPIYPGEGGGEAGRCSVVVLSLLHDGLLQSVNAYDDMS